MPMDDTRHSWSLLHLCHVDRVFASNAANKVKSLHIPTQRYGVGLTINAGRLVSVSYEEARRLRPCLYVKRDFGRQLLRIVTLQQKSNVVSVFTHNLIGATDHFATVRLDRQDSAYDAPHDDFERIGDLRKILHHTNIDISMPPFSMPTTYSNQGGFQRWCERHV